MGARQCFVAAEGRAKKIGEHVKRIGIGVIGTGFIGPAHIEALRRLPQVEVVALAEYSEQAATEKAAALGIDTPYGDYAGLIHD